MLFNINSRLVFFMDRKSLEHYKGKLLKEKERVEDTLSLMKKNETIDSSAEISSELSLYDNHPSDIGEEMSDLAKGRALKSNEISIISKINDALVQIEEGSYGVCKDCGTDIPEARLEFIPYASLCVNCQNDRNNKEKALGGERPTEESVLGNPFGYGFNDFKSDNQFDAEDSYQAVARFDNIRNTPDYFDDDDQDLDYADPMDKISNEQYKNQLPD
jgi:YteA family regulatory protein